MSIMKKNASRMCLKLKRIKRYKADDDGVAAVEFGLVAVPFFALLFGILEIAIVMFAGEVLEIASENAAREIRTGQAQRNGVTADQFRDKVCDKFDFLFTCASIRVNVTSYPDFGSINTSVPQLGSNGQFTGANSFDPGDALEIAVVQVFYPWQIFARLPGFNLATNGNYRILSSTLVFRNEPFPDT